MLPNPNALTPGFKTSEFIMSIIPILLGIVFVIIGLIQKNEATVNQGLTLLLGGSGIYGVSRGLTKLGHGIGPNIPVDTVASTPVPATDTQAADAVAKIP